MPAAVLAGDVARGDVVVLEVLEVLVRPEAADDDDADAGEHERLDPVTGVDPCADGHHDDDGEREQGHAQETHGDSSMSGRVRFCAKLLMIT